MCTAVNDGSLFGRTLDIHRSFGEKIIITPRNYKLELIREKDISSHLCLIGVACAVDSKPLYYDAINEKGLGMAGLNFPKNAVYHNEQRGKHNVASFELIPWILGQCASCEEAFELLEKTNITSDSFSDSLPTTPLHWIVADEHSALTIESVEEGLKIYENPFGVLTNNPPFPYHMAHVAEFINLDSTSPKNTLCPQVTLNKYGNGFGAIGLPGDFSPASRFVRAVFAKNHTTHAIDKMGEINRFFNIMNTVSLPKGCVKIEDGSDSLTVYVSCAERESLTYYFVTHDCRRIRGVRITTEMLEQSALSIFSMKSNNPIEIIN